MKSGVLAALGLATGVLLGLLTPIEWLVAPALTDVHEEQAWACPMLCVVKSRPGLCPVCGMDLERLEDGGDQLQLTVEQREMIGLSTGRVERRLLTRRIRTVGTIDYNERHVRTISAWVDGRVVRLYADHTYSDVRKGDHVLRLYSPELFVAQQEFLLAGSANDLGRKKLGLLGMLDTQIEALKRRGTPSEHMDIFSPISGKVIKLSVREGEYVKEGEPLYTVSDFDTFWLRFDAYEEDLPWLAVGQEVEVTLDAYRGLTFPAAISFIEPEVNRTTRTTKVRATVANRDKVLKPGMLANVTVLARLGPDSRAVPPPLAGKYGCYMHPEERSDGPTQCPICGMGMELNPRPDSPHQHGAKLLAVPRQAVLSTGARHVVYVQAKEGMFSLREVKIGLRSGDWVHVRAGLAEGELVALGGAMLIDSQMQLTGRPSLLRALSVSHTGAGSHAGH